MSHFSEFFEITSEQIESVFDVLEKDGKGRVAYSELEKLLNTLINDEDSFEEAQREFNTGGRHPALIHSIEMAPEEAAEYLEDDDSQVKKSISISSTPGKSKIYESIVDIDIDWNNFQELKLILYSINFNGNEKLKFSELEKQFGRLVTSNYSRHDLETIFSILQNERSEITREDIENFVNEAEANIKNNQLGRSTNLNAQTASQLMRRNSDISLGGGSVFKAVNPHDTDVSYMLDTLNIIAHKIDELRGMKMNKDGQSLLNILLKLNTDLSKGLDNFKNHFENLNQEISELQSTLKEQEQLATEAERSLMLEKFNHSETLQQVKDIQNQLRSCEKNLQATELMLDRERDKQIEYAESLSTFAELQKKLAKQTEREKDYQKKLTALQERVAGLSEENYKANLKVKDLQERIQERDDREKLVEEEKGSEADRMMAIAEENHKRGARITDLEKTIENLMLEINKQKSEAEAERLEGARGGSSPDLQKLSIQETDGFLQRVLEFTNGTLPIRDNDPRRDRLLSQSISENSPRGSHNGVATTPIAISQGPVLQMATITGLERVSSAQTNQVSKLNMRVSIGVEANFDLFPKKSTSSFSNSPITPVPSPKASTIKKADTVNSTTQTEAEQPKPQSDVVSKNQAVEVKYIVLLPQIARDPLIMFKQVEFFYYANTVPRLNLGTISLNISGTSKNKNPTSATRVPDIPSLGKLDILSASRQRDSEQAVEAAGESSPVCPPTSRVVYQMMKSEEEESKKTSQKTTPTKESNSVGQSGVPLTIKPLNLQISPISEAKAFEEQDLQSPMKGPRDAEPAQTRLIIRPEQALSFVEKSFKKVIITTGRPSVTQPKQKKFAFEAPRTLPQEESAILTIASVNRVDYPSEWEELNDTTAIQDVSGVAANNRSSYMRLDLNTGIVRQSMINPYENDNTSEAIRKILKKDKPLTSRGRKEAFPKGGYGDNSKSMLEDPFSPHAFNRKALHQSVIEISNAPISTSFYASEKTSKRLNEASRMSESPDLMPKRMAKSKEGGLQKDKKSKLKDFFREKANQATQRGKETTNFSRDYLDLLKMKEIVDYMNKQNVRLDRIFSESIFLYSDLTTKDRHILMITYSQLLILRPGKLKIKYAIELESLKELSIPKQNEVILIVKLKSNEDIMIETFKRFEVVRFLHQLCEERGQKKISVTEAKNSNILLNKREGVIDEKTLLKYEPEIQGAYRAAFNMGYLHTWSKKSWYGSGDWSEKFFLLSNIGLLFFDKPGIVKIEGFIPIIGSVILDNPKHLFEKKNIFKVTYADSKTEIFLAARSEIEKKQWIFTLNKVQELAAKGNNIIDMAI